MATNLRRETLSSKGSRIEAIKRIIPGILSWFVRVAYIINYPKQKIERKENWL